ncbi:unnamed protein product [Prunus brigantina]
MEASRVSDSSDFQSKTKIVADLIHPPSKFKHHGTFLQFTLLHCFLQLSLCHETPG